MTCGETIGCSSRDHGADRNTATDPVHGRSERVGRSGGGDRTHDLRINSPYSVVSGSVAKCHRAWSEAVAASGQFAEIRVFSEIL